MTNWAKITTNKGSSHRKFPMRKHTKNFGGFTQEDKDINVAMFCENPEHKNLWDRLTEVEQRMPWTRELIKSLKDYVGGTGKLSSAQMGLATNLYIDCCMITDERMDEQVAVRKMGYRLLELELGQKTRMFVGDVMVKCGTRRFTPGQVRALNNIASRYSHALAQIDDLPDEEFDGWLKIIPVPKEGEEDAPKLVRK